MIQKMNIQFDNFKHCRFSGTLSNNYSYHKEIESDKKNFTYVREKKNVIRAKLLCVSTDYEDHLNYEEQKNTEHEQQSKNKKIC